MVDPRRPTPAEVPPGGWDPVPTEAEQEARFSAAITAETRPFFALADQPIAAARWAEYSHVPSGGRDNPGRAFFSLAIRYGTDRSWVKVGTRFGELPTGSVADTHRESLVRSDIAFEMGLEAAEPGDGEASWNQEAMLARIRAAQADAETMVADILLVDGEPVAAQTMQAGSHRRTWFSVPVGGWVYVHTCRWDGPVELRRSRDYGALGRDDR